MEQVAVPEHRTKRLTLLPTRDLRPFDEGWTFTWARTGCLRVQRGDFTAYLTHAQADALLSFLDFTISDPEGGGRR